MPPTKCYTLSHFNSRNLQSLPGQGLLNIGPPHQHLVMERGGACKALPLPGYAYRQLTVAREVEFLKPHPSPRIHGQLMDTGGRRDNFFSGAAPGKLSRLLYLFNPSSMLLHVTWSELIAGREESIQAPTPASYGSRREANEEEGRWGRGWERETESECIPTLINQPDAILSLKAIL